MKLIPADRMLAFCRDPYPRQAEITIWIREKRGLEPKPAGIMNSAALRLIVTGEFP